MDNRLEEALSAINYRITISNQLENLKFKAKTRLAVAEAGGVFNIDQSLISFLQALKENSHTSAVLLDANGSPIMINVTEFLEKILSIYMEVTIDLYNEYQEVKKTRNLKTLYRDE